ncbi:hypothetical protein [Streptomyces sp. NBC_01435]|uniref:hypothetical protein n=1 Tax=Streptomyces sp. NBC_01435 TaxID=2903865 RepID=UPI002E377F97|nr:hypothetical protein [Streptomyces sp. NBC_01435]
MSEVNDIPDAPPSPSPPPPVDAKAPGDGDVPEEGDAGSGVENAGQAAADDAGDGDVPDPEHTAEAQATGAEEFGDGDIGVRETTAEQPTVELASAGQQPPGGTEPPRPPTSADPPDRPDRSVPPEEPIAVEEAGKNRKLSDSPTATDQVAIDDSPTPVDRPDRSLKSDSDSEPENTPAAPADVPSQRREAAERLEQAEAAADEAQGDADDTSAGTARSDQSGDPEEEPTPLEQAEEQQPPAPEASTEWDTGPAAPDRTAAAETGDAREAREARDADTIPVPYESDAGPDDKAEPTEESEEPAEARLTEGSEEPPPEAGSVGEVVDVAESDGATDTTGDAELEEGAENATTKPATDEFRTQEPQDGAAAGDSRAEEDSDVQQGGPDSRGQMDSELEADSRQPPSNIQERIRQAVGAARNWANDTYLGRLFAGRPMEPWKSNRALHRSLDGARPPANAVVADLEKIGRGNGVIGYKDVNAKLRPDGDLINSVFAPRDGQYISTHVDNPGVIGQGNHRAEELLKRAKDPHNPNIEMSTPIFIHRVGEMETDAVPKEQE